MTRDTDPSGAWSRRAVVGGIGGGLAAGLTLLPGAVRSVAARQADPAEEEIAALAERFFETVNGDDLDALDDLAAEDIVGHVTPIVPLPGRGEGLAGVKENIAALRAGFPDAEATLEDLVVQGDRAAARLTLRGTHDGEIQGIAPTGAAVEVPGLALVRFEDGLAVEYWAELDGLSVALQLGLLELPAPAAAQGSPAATSDLDGLIELPGVVLAVEFTPEGEVVDHRSRLELPDAEIERAARYAATASTVAGPVAEAYTELTGLVWEPAQWAVYSGGRWTTAIAGSRAVIAQTDQIDFNGLYAALVGEA